MANSFELRKEVIEEMSLAAYDRKLNLQFQNFKLSRGFDDRIAVGDEITISYPNDVVAQMTGLQSSSLGLVSDVTYANPKIKVIGSIYANVVVTPEDTKLNTLNNDQFLNPAIEGVMERVETEAALWRNGNFAAYGGILGVAGNPITVGKDIGRATKTLRVNTRKANNQFAGIVSPDSALNIGELDINSSKDYGEGKPLALQDGYVTKMHGVDLFEDSRFDDGFEAFMPSSAGAQDELGLALSANGAIAQGATSFPADGFTVSDRFWLMRTGSQFTVEDVADTTFTVTSGVTVASNAGTINVTPAFPSSAADNAALTMTSGFDMSCVFDPSVVAFAPIPYPITHPEIQSIVRIPGLPEGTGITVTRHALNTDTMAATYGFHCFIAAGLARNDYGVIANGASA